MKVSLTIKFTNFKFILMFIKLNDKVHYLTKIKTHIKPIIIKENHPKGIRLIYQYINNDLMNHNIYKYFQPCYVIYRTKLLLFLFPNL